MNLQSLYDLFNVRHDLNLTWIRTYDKVKCFFFRSLFASLSWVVFISYRENLNNNESLHVTYIYRHQYNNVDFDVSYMPFHDRISLFGKRVFFDKERYILILDVNY